MKKIVGILSAAAVLAASVFAADVSAKVKLTGSLLNYADDDFTALKLNNHAAHGYEPLMSMGVSTDNAGATVKIKNLNEWVSGEGLTDTSWNIWFKAFDLVKVDMGQISGSLNQETIDYSLSNSTWDNGGYGVTVNTNGVEFGVYSLEGWGSALVSNEKMNDLIAKAAYSANFGTISAMFEYDSAHEVTLFKDFFHVPTSELCVTKMKLGDIVFKSGKPAGSGDTYIFKDMGVKDYIRFGAGYNAGNLISENFSFFANVMGETGKIADNMSAFVLTPEVFAKYSAGAFSAAAFVKVPVVFYDVANLPDGAEILPDLGVWATAKVSYAFENGMTAYLYVKEGFLKEFDHINVKPGIKGNVGICAWEVAADMNIGEKFSIDVPVSLTVDF